VVIFRKEKGRHPPSALNAATPEIFILSSRKL
jgi:hypothetical protein